MINYLCYLKISSVWPVMLRAAVVNNVLLTERWLVVFLLIHRWCEHGECCSVGENWWTGLFLSVTVLQVVGLIKVCFVFRQQVIFVWSVLSAQQNVGHIVFSCCENWWPSGTNITSGIICTRSAGGRRINTPTTACRWRPINWASDGADTKVWRPDVNVSFQLCVDSSETLSKQLLLLTAQLQSMFHPAERVRYIWSKPGVHLSRSRQKHSLNSATWIDAQLFQTFLIMNTENIHFYEWFSCFGRTRRLQKTNCCQL